MRRGGGGGRRLRRRLRGLRGRGRRGREAGQAGVVQQLGREVGADGGRLVPGQVPQAVPGRVLIRQPYNKISSKTPPDIQRRSPNMG